MNSSNTKATIRLIKNSNNYSILDSSTLSKQSDVDIIYTQRIQTSSSPTHLLLISKLPEANVDNLQNVAKSFLIGKTVVTTAMYNVCQGYCLAMLFDNPAFAKSMKEMHQNKSTIIKTRIGSVAFNYNIDYCYYPLCMVVDHNTECKEK